MIVLIVLLAPLLRSAGPVPDHHGFDAAVYRDQLRELDRDAARGLLTQTDVAAARLEIPRRLLAAGGAGGAEQVQRTGRNPVAAVAVALVVAGGSAGLYALLGAPSIADAPFVASASAGESPHGGGAGADHGDLAQAAVRLAEKLKTDPANVDGWLLYARTSGSLRHWDQAIDAYHHAIALGAGGAEIQSGLGEMLVLQTGGIVTPTANDAFAAALKDDPKNAVARYYLALAAMQAGEPEKAISLLQGVLADIPEDSPMREEIAQRVAEAAKAAGVPVPPLAKGAPAAEPDTDADALDAAAAMPEGEQKAMIAAMVARLAAAVAARPDDVDGWMRLGRAYAVMGQPDKAADAYDRAAALKPGDVGIRLTAADGLLSGLKPDDPLPPRAVALLRQVEVLAPDQPEVLWYLGIVAARDAHPAEARRYWARLLTQLPADGEDARMVRKAQDALGGG